MEVEQIIDDLYAVRPTEFVAARAVRVAEARTAGDAAAANRIAKLRRPTLAAWASNRFVRERPAEVQQLLALGETLREAHRALDADSLREASGQQHKLITTLAREAASLAREAGLPLTETVLHDVEQVFHAVLASPDLAIQWSAGRLVKSPETAIGFGAIAPQAVPAHQPPVGKLAPKVAGDRSRTGAEKQRRDRLERARTRAEATAAAAKRAEEELQTAQQAHRSTLSEVIAADEHVEQVKQELRQAETIQQRAQAAAAEAETRVTQAQGAVRAARRAAAAADRAVARHTTRPGPPGAAVLRHSVIPAWPDTV
jgi:hypothetical protein